MDREYDVAISFLSRDEAIAQELYDRLSPNLRVFIFTQRQEEIAGTNGLESFRRVFLSGSSLVVVLHRDGWGDTPWTRVEMGAIEDRFLKEGAAFLFFVSLSSRAKPPPWVRDTLIRFNLEDYGVVQAAGTIKRRAEEVGAKFSRETAEERALRTEAKLTFNKETKQLFHSEEGVRAAQDAAIAFAEALHAKVKIVAKAAPVLDMRGGVSEAHVGVSTSRVSVDAYFYVRYCNTLDYARLTVKFLRGRIILPEEKKQYIERPTVLSELHYTPERTRALGWCWKEQDGTLRGSTDLAEHIMGLILEKSEETA